MAPTASVRRVANISSIERELNEAIVLGQKDVAAFLLNLLRRAVAE